MTSKISRILMTGDAVGGVWTYAIDLSRALGELGIEVVLAVMGRRLSERQHREAWSVPTLTVIEGPYKLEWMTDPWQDVDRAGEWLLELEREHTPDVVHVNGYAHGALPFAAPVLVVGHSCVLSWWQAVKGERAPASWDVYRARVEAGLRAAESVVTPTAAMLAALSQCYGPIPNGAVIPNGCDLARFAPDAKEPFVLTAGRIWDEAKNIGALARAASSVRWPIYAAGDDQRPPGTGEAVDNLEAHRIRMLGHLSRSDLASWLGRAAIYALPARYEPFGLSILEAAASGCALVLGDIASLRELWEGAATFVHPDDSDGLARALEALIADDATRERLGSAALARAQRYSLRELRSAYLKLYEDLVTNRRRRARRIPSTRPMAP